MEQHETGKQKHIMDRVLEQTTPEPTFDVYVDDQSGRRYSVDRVTIVS